MGGGGSKIGGQTWAMLGHVGTMLAQCWLNFPSWAPFFALGRFGNASWTFLARVHCFLGGCRRSGSNFPWSGPGFEAFNPTFFDVPWC